MTDMDDLPIIELPGSEQWLSGYELAELLEKRFPGQGTSDFGSAITYNDRGPFTTVDAVTDFVMEEEGANESADWVWRISFTDGTTWLAEGGCDYTGWDCQSDLRWGRA